LQNREIDDIINNSEVPDFENTIGTIANSGSFLKNVSAVFYSQISANTNDDLQKIDQEISPILSAHYDGITLNRGLFDRIESVYNKKDQLKLTDEQEFLLENYYQDFIRNGANLNPDKQDELKKINQQLSVFNVQFSQNLLAETNDFKMIIEDKEDLAGLPESVIQAAAETAKENSLDGKWLFTVQKPSMIPFLQFSKKKDLREKLYKGYINRGNNNNEHDNKKLLSDIVKLRVKKAKLLGFNNFAELQLDDKMAKTPAEVYKLLNRLWDASLPVAKKEAAELQTLIDAEGGNFKLASWDWWYYAEKLRKQKYNLDDNELRPYFELNNVREGAFSVAHKLYGITFTPIENIPVPHSDAQAFEVKEADGAHMGILYMDFYPRASKAGGAWCGTYRSEYRKDGEHIAPVVTVVCNFTQPAGDTPSLLSMDEVETLFHEFGHALDELFADCTYQTRFEATDFVELPSQIMEHWAFEPVVMQDYAKHYQTGETISSELISKIENSRYFNQGFITVEYLAASLLDMKYHTLTKPQDLDINKFESEFYKEIGLIPEIVSRYRGTYFAHITTWGYSAGYYSYIWSGVLDADGFEAFKEISLFDQKTAKAFRENVLEKNGREDPLKLYVQFRGREPKIEPLLKNRGLL
jgi:peptidyl-dipeptidase Dcp